MIKKTSDTEWTLYLESEVYIKAKISGIDIDGNEISWADLDKAKYEAEKSSVQKDPFDSLAEYLRRREKDIALDIEDFGDLAGCFYEMIGRLPKAE